MNTRGGSDEKELVNQTEDLINSIDTKITNYLMSVSKENLNDRDMQDFNLHLPVSYTHLDVYKRQVAYVENLKPLV